MSISHHRCSPVPGRVGGDGSNAPLRTERSQAGETLIEVMVSVVLMGLVVTAILGGIFTLISVSNANNEKTKVALALQAYAEQIEQPVADLEYRPCNDPTNPGTKAYYQGKLDATIAKAKLPAGYSMSFDLYYWRTVTGFGGGAFNTTTCPAGGDLGLQRFVITITNNRTGSAAATETLAITKRDTRCPTFYDNLDAGPC